MKYVNNNIPKLEEEVQPEENLLARFGRFNSEENLSYFCLAVLFIIFAALFYYRIQIKKRQTNKAATNLKDFEYPNVAFYSNQIPSEPNGDYIDNMLNLWRGDYLKLEKDHCYIQWLFPNPQLGVNQESHPLRDEEAKIISRTPELKERVKRSFEMMLDFYGMTLTKDNKFELAYNAPERLNELNQWGNHNFLRISRILLALKLLGHSNLMLPWMKLLVDLIYVEKVLDVAASSFENYWLATLDAEDKIELNKYKRDRE